MKNHPHEANTKIGTTLRTRCEDDTNKISQPGEY